MDNSWSIVRASIESNPSLSDIEKKRRELDFLWQDLSIVRAKEQSEYNSLVCVLYRLQQQHDLILKRIEVVLQEIRDLEEQARQKQKRPKIGAPRQESPLTLFAMLDDNESDDMESD